MPDDEMLPEAKASTPFLTKGDVSALQKDGKPGPQIFEIYDKPYLQKANKPGFKDQVIAPGKHIGPGNATNSLWRIPLNAAGHKMLQDAFTLNPAKWVGQKISVDVGIVPAGAQKGKPTFVFTVVK